MNLHWIDWSIVAALLLVITFAANATRKYVKSVADYLAANRCAGRYVISVADTMALVGAVTIIASYEAYYRAGFTFGWWGMLGGVMFLVALSGWVQYRFRQTRALTMAQFLETRYSKKFRVFFGIQTFFSGITSFGIFPAVAGRFFMYLCGFPSHKVTVLGFWEVDLTLAAIMLVLLMIALYFTFVGGQIAVIVTDFLQGTFTNIAFMAVLLFILIKLPWSEIHETLVQRPPGESMMDPFDAGKFKLFNMWYFIIQTLAAIWFYMAWQGNQGYNTSAINAHEARMAKAMGVWRMCMQGVPIAWVALAAYIVLHGANWTPLAEKINAVLNTISTDPADTIRKQVTTTVAIARFLPVGLLGAFCGVMLASFISCHDTCLHSWGSIFIQDVVLPFKKVRLSPKQHLKWLRLSSLGVAIWIFCFSLVFSQYDAIFMFFALIGILGAGAGSVIVFGLYWKKGTTTAAFSAMITGITGFILCFTLQKLWLYIYNKPFPINSQWLMFIFMNAAIVVYVLVALLSRKKHDFNMNKMLHRGEYAIAADDASVTDIPVRGWQALFGMTREFTRFDKIIYCFFGCWSIFWFMLFCVVCLYRAFFDIPVEIWSKYWWFSAWLNVYLAIGTTIWFTIGGIIGLKKMFHRLGTMKRDATDDGEIIEDASEDRDLST